MIDSIYSRKVAEVRWCLDRDSGINRIYHRSPMQTEKSEPSGQRIMPETRLNPSPWANG